MFLGPKDAKQQDSKADADTDNLVVSCFTSPSYPTHNSDLVPRRPIAMSLPSARVIPPPYWVIEREGGIS